MHTEKEDISMAESKQIIEQDLVLEGMLILEDASIYVDLEAKRNADVE